MSDDTETKLSAARTKLILDKPFLGALVMRLPMIEANPDWCPTTATDARAFFYNKDFIDALDLSQTQYILAHEALHCALSHFARRSHRVKSRWDLACDYAINPILVNDGLTPPPGIMIMREYAGMTAEEIYPLIDENTEDETIDRHLYDDFDQFDSDGSSGGHMDETQLDQNNNGQQSRQQDQQSGGQGKGDQQEDPDQGNGREDGNASRDKEGKGEGGAKQPPPLTQEEQERLSMQWRQRMAGAAQQAQQANKLSDAIARMVHAEISPVLPWRLLLAKYMMAIGRDDYSYMRPSRREGDAIFPSLRSGQLEVFAVVDTSGSINPEEMDAFLAEINAIKAQVRARVVLHACDDALDENGPWIYEPWEQSSMPEKFGGGRGTNFQPVFEWIEKDGLHPDLLIYFTDAEGRFPGREPSYPVIWLVKGKQEVPWGQRIQLN